MNEEMTAITKPDSYSVKTTTDVTERIQELVKKTGLNHKDLFSAMVTRFYTELESGSELDQSDDMQQIRYHLNRVENVYLGSLQKVQDLKKDYSERLEEQKNKYKEVLEELHQLKKERTQEFDDLTKINEDTEIRLREIQQRNQELEESSVSYRMTVELLSHRVEELETERKSFESAQEEMISLKEELFLVKQNQGNLQLELSTSQQIISKLESQLNEAKNLSQKELEQLQRSFTKEISQLKELHALELEKVRIDSDRRTLERLQTVQFENEQKTDKLIARNEALSTKNQELTEKLHSFELEIQKLRDYKLNSTRTN